MEYKLLRMLLIFLQIGLIILVVLLVSLVVFPSSIQAHESLLQKSEPQIQTKEVVLQRFIDAREQHKTLIQMQAFEKSLFHNVKQTLNKEFQFSSFNHKSELFSKKV
jgi:uncharacterized GH25 family protein